MREVSGAETCDANSAVAALEIKRQEGKRVVSGHTLRVTDDKENPLAPFRDAIDAVDTQLLSLLNKRAQLAVEVGEIKRRDPGRGSKSEHAVFYVPDRERAIIDQLQEKNSGPFPSSALRPVFQEIISACLSLEASVTVAYLGPEATFTHQAVRRHFGTSARAVPCGSIGAVFSEVTRGQADFGVVPVENSTEGVVNHTLDSFLDAELAIHAEISVNVDHCLLTRDDVPVSEIERVYSHPQALAQCRAWLTANLPRATLVESSSTAAAAQAAARDAKSAAIAAEFASRIYGLTVARTKLQDVSENITRFLVVGGPRASGSLTDDYAHERFKTSLVLSLPDRPGCLHEILQPIAQRGINLTRIESRPTRRKAWDYVFFLDLDGHTDHPEVAEVIRELEEICALCRVLGSYRKADVI